MPKQTKGPWIPHVTDGGHLVFGPDGYAVCALPCIVRGVEEVAANAELIAMGPDLLYRLSALVKVVRRSDVEAADAGGVDSDDYDAALEEAETLLALLAESGVTVGEVS